MTPFSRISTWILSCCLLSIVSTSCTKENNTTDPTPTTIKSDTLVTRILVNGKQYKQIVYDSSKRVKTLYTFSSTQSDTMKMPYQERSDYQYNSLGKITKLTSTNANGVSREWDITYVADTIYYNSGSDSYKYPLIRSGNTIRLGDTDTIFNPNNGVSAINFEKFTMQGDDLAEYYYADYYQNKDVYGWDLSYGERYTYGTTLNPLWQLIQDNPFLGLEFLSTESRYARPFAYVLSKHNPISISRFYTTRNFFPADLSLQYQLYPGTQFPVEQKWIDDSKSSVFTTFTFEYSKVP